MMRRPAPGSIANFDSASTMLRATARSLRGKDFPPMGMNPLLKPLMFGTNLLPRRGRERTYAVSGGGEGVSARGVKRVSLERIARWAVSQYPSRQYPAVMLGSSNGAAVHLCAALGIPWLPQTTLIPVRRRPIHPDDILGEMEWGRQPARALLEANPDIQLHHMHDPNQDRLMVTYRSYFRTKRLRLGEAYEQFLADSLEPGGTIFLLECDLRWPGRKLGDRHFFQIGALGGIEAEEYLHGSDRVEDYLARYESDRRKWIPPEPDGEYPEAEWGFEQALRTDVERFAEERGFNVRRIRFEEPEALSPLVADLHRWWYRRRRMLANRLIVDSFTLMDPHWTLRTGSVPFWSKFPVESSARTLEDYLESSDPFDEIHLMLFSHGTESAGLASVERWREILARARNRGALLGVDAEEFPVDFGTFARYHDEIRRLPARYPLPGPLGLGQLEEFLRDRAERYAVGWDEAAERERELV